MIKIIILGGGNLAFHLTKCLLTNDKFELIQVYNRNLKNIDYLKNKVAITNQISELKNADIYIISVSDTAISELSKMLIFNNKLVIHTSGGIDMKDLHSTSNKGVFYPLQSFSKEKEVDFLNVPICIEASTKKDLDVLEKLAKSISKKVYKINSEQRKNIHVSAVFVNNFVNHLYYIGNEICITNNIPFEILLPIIKETAKKVETLSPFDAQTGPAIRNDSGTIEKHLAILNYKQQEIYTLLTKSIQETYGKKL